MNRYENLVIKSQSYERVRKQTELLHHHKTLAWLLRGLGSFCGVLGRYSKSAEFVINRKLSYTKRLESLERTTKLLRENSEGASLFGSGYGYENATRELKTNIAYRSQLLKKELGIQIDTESFDLYDFALNKLSAILKQNTIGTVINFGVAYAYIDSVLAQRFPHTKFLGVDRSEATKTYNEQYFTFPNLLFEAGDIFDNLHDNSLLLQMRIGVLLPKKFLAELYSKCKESGVEQITIFEPHGISWTTGKSYEFSDDDKESVPFRSGMFLHNYPGILKMAGFQVYESELVKTGHQDEDYRILYMAANRID